MAFVAPFPAAASQRHPPLSPPLSAIRPSRLSPASMTLARPPSSPPRSSSPSSAPSATPAPAAASSSSPSSPPPAAPEASASAPAPTLPSAPAPAPAPAPAASPEEPIPSITGHAEFLAACAASADDTLVVVQVKAPWCRSCKALEPKVRRLAREYMGTVRFFAMNYEDPENKPIAFRAGVKSMPTFMFFCGAAGKVEQFTCGPNRAGMLREKIEMYVAGECAVAEDGASENKAAKAQPGRP